MAVQYGRRVYAALVVAVACCVCYLAREGLEMAFYELLYSNYKLESSVTIVGTARDVEAYVPMTIKKMEMVLSLFRSGSIVIYENDSKDNTLKMLQQWAKRNKNVALISEKNVEGKRTHRLAYARNLLMRAALGLGREYVVVMDMDDKNRSLRRRPFLTSFQYKDLEWAMMAANQKRKYYDVWALRTYDNWLTFDWMQCARVVRNMDFCLTHRSRNVPAHSEPIAVKSAFGGVAVYRARYLLNATYRGGEGEGEVCEHVSFNEDVRTKNGGKLYINPKMIIV